PENIHHKEEAEKKNAEMFRYAGDRESLHQRWNVALANGVSLVEEIKIPYTEERAYKAVKSLYFTKTIANLIATLGFGLLGFIEAVTQGLGKMRIRSKTDLYLILLGIAIMGIVYFGRHTLKTFRLYMTYRDISKD